MKYPVLCDFVPSVVIAESIVTCWPPETGLTAAIVSTDLLPSTALVVSVYFQVLPTSIGNGTEPDETTDVEPPELPELVPADLELPDPPDEPDPPDPAVPTSLDPDEPEPPELQPARTRPAAAARTATAVVGRRRASA